MEQKTCRCISAASVLKDSELSTRSSEDPSLIQMYLSVLMYILHAKNLLEGVSGELIAEAAKKFGHRNVIYVKDKNDIPSGLMR
jgi:hypothetical protein